MDGLEIAVGTYEELVLGFKVVESTEDEGLSIEPTFSDHSHTASIRAVAVNRRGILATGSADESIRLFNLRRHVEIGSLMHHNGTVTCLEFYGKTHLFSASEDGSIGVWQVGKWECLRTLRGHKGAVLSISVHPTGKMALSVGRDKALRTWNLITGKTAYITNIKQVAEIVMWSACGQYYLVAFGNKIDVYSVETAEIHCTFTCAFRIGAITFVKEDTFIAGGEEGKVEMYTISKKAMVHSFPTETSRVKGVATCIHPVDINCYCLLTGSSDGYVKLWKLEQEKSGWSHELLCERDAGFRCISVALLPTKATQPAVVKVKQDTKVKAESQDSEDEEEDDKEEDEGSEESDDDDELEESEEEEEEEEVKVTKRKSKPKKQQAQKKQAQKRQHTEAEHTPKRNQESAKKTKKKTQAKHKKLKST